MFIRNIDKILLSNENDTEGDIEIFEGDIDDIYVNVNTC